MSIGAHKAVARKFLARRDIKGIVQWAESVRNPQRALISLAFDPEELIRWRTVEALGQVAAMLGKRDMETVRELIRKLLWLMNDESGGLCRLSPELIGEILAQLPELAEEYAGILPSFLSEEPFERGAHWAVYRLAPEYPELLKPGCRQLGHSLTDIDPAIRAYAALTLKAIGTENRSPLISALKSDKKNLTVYDIESGALVETTVGEFVTQGFTRLEALEQVA